MSNRIKFIIYYSKSIQTQYNNTVLSLSNDIIEISNIQFKDLLYKTIISSKYINKNSRLKIIIT